MSEAVQLKDVKVVPDPIHPYPDSIKDSGSPLVIDNGSYHCRAGWVSDEKPRLIFKNLMARLRREKGKKDIEVLVGNDVANIEAVRFQLKTQFERNVITHFEAQEHVCDYIFTHMGIDTDGSVNHPIVMTETFLNPNYCRHLTSELLFECYHVPSVVYGVDGLFSLGYNYPEKTNSALIINCGYHTTHVLPVLQGRADPTKSRRINIGGFHMTSFMHRLLQLKYPVHSPAITLSRAEELLQQHTYIAEDYQAELKQWSNYDYYDENVRRIQLPYVSAPVMALTPEQQKERRKELAKRLVEINARRREERLAEDEERLQCLLNLQEMWDDGEEEELEAALKELEVENVEDLQKTITQLHSRIEKVKQKMTAAEEVVEEPKPKNPRDSMNPKEREDFDSWITGVKKKRTEILLNRNLRRQRRQDMAKRRTVAAQERMRIISQLARKEKKDDNFGMRDEDWDVYKTISKEGGDTDSEAEQEQLNELEQVLRCHDPQFQAEIENQDPDHNPGNPAEGYQLHVGVERVRVPELLFQPSMLGIEQAGVAETIQHVLKQYPETVQQELVGNIFLTGGCSSFPGLLRRMQKEMLEMRPMGSKFSINLAGNPVLDSWNGARSWASLPENESFFVSRAEYEENGGEYLKEHSASNKHYAWPSPLVVLSQEAWSSQEQPEGMGEHPMDTGAEVEVEVEVAEVEVS